MQSCIVIPCYNESARLLEDSFLNYLISNPRVYFLFVDDGSRDDTRKKLVALAEKSSQIKFLALKTNMGKAEAVRQGFLHSFQYNPQYVGYWDADLATPLNEISRFIDFLGSHPEIDFLVGSRVKLLGKDIHRKPFRHYLGRVFATCASLVLGLAVYDTQCGAKMFRYSENLEDIFRVPFISRWVFDVEIFARWKTKMPVSSIYEMPLERWQDIGNSKLKLGDFFRAFFDLLRIYVRH